MCWFSLAYDYNITIGPDGRTALPTRIPVPVGDILNSYVKPVQSATKGQGTNIFGLTLIQ